MAIVALIAIVACVLYELIVPGRRLLQSNSSVAARIERLASSTDVVTEKWCSDQDNGDFVDKLWEMPIDQEWKSTDVSYYLFHHDSMVFWSNHIYSDSNFNRIILTQSDHCVELDSSKVLIFHHSDSSGHQAVTVVRLSAGQKGANRAIFDRSDVQLFTCCNNVNPQRDSEISHIETFEVAGKHFLALMPLYDRESATAAFVGWIGIFAAIIAFILLTIYRTTNKNVFRQLITVLLTLVCVRVVEFYVDFPQGGSYYWNSLTSILISQLMIMLLMIYLYSVRWKVAYRIKHMSVLSANLTFAVFTLLMCVAIVFFHLTMVDIVYQHKITVELYSIFSMSLTGVNFYIICSIFAVYRILYGFVLRAVFAGKKPWVNIVLSETILILLVIVLSNRMYDSQGYLLFMHFIFMVVSFATKQTSQVRMFIVSVITLTIYICFFAAAETRVAKLEEAKKYANALFEDPKNPPVPVYKNFTYTIASPNNVYGNAPNMGELSDLLIFNSSSSQERVIMRESMVYIIKHSGEVTVVVAYRAANFIDFLSLICYIFIGLYIIVGCVLTILGVKVYGHTSFRQLSNKIRYAVVAIVFFSMVIVVWITEVYSKDNYQSHKREILGSQVKGLLESFSKFAKDNYSERDNTVSSDSMLIEWYDTQASGFTSDICIYNKSGKKLIDNGIGDEKPTMIDYKVWRGAISYKMPYVVVNDELISSAYASLFVSDEVRGFVRVTSRDVYLHPDRYILLDNVLNMFVILLVFSITLSTALYSLIAGPLKLLTESMNGVGRLQKIPINRRYSMNDEVGTLITQYNRMVDYLEENYKKITISERENTWREMARQVAHEIKNPLTPMRLKIQMLQRARAEGYADIDRRTNETLELLIEQIDVLSNIASAFSDMARLEQGETVRLELDSVLESIVALYRDNSESLEIALRFDNPSPVFVEASYSTLSRLFVNLLQNAMQALQCNGKILVSLKQQDGMAVVDVADNGRGIPPDLLYRIFEPNFTTRSSGSGLGLAICRQIAASYRGSISVESEQDKGAVFTVRLPLAPIVNSSGLTNLMISDTVS